MQKPPIDLIAERKKREERPDAAHVCVVAEGGKPVQYFEFECSYRANDGETYVFAIWAKDAADADLRVAALRQTARVDGQIFEAFSP